MLPGSAVESPAELRQNWDAVYVPAVIAALHATDARWEDTDWDGICRAYDRLIAITNSPVAKANRALAVGFRDGFVAGLAALDEVAEDPRMARSNTVATIRADLLRIAHTPFAATSATTRVVAERAVMDIRVCERAIAAG